MMKNILIAEDDKDIVELLALYLESSNYNVFKSYNGVDALEIFNNNALDLILADVMMEKMDGYELVKEIRKVSDVPVIFVSAKNEDNDRILGLNLGADAYITKPFNPLEVLAYINALFRRLSSNNKNILIGDIKLDLETYQVYKKDKLLNLTTAEIKILALLMKNPGKVFTKYQLYENINNNLGDDDNTIMVHISNLRSKLDDKDSKYIVTVRGLGYKFENKN
ncbi:MAG: response regulator transcription factor [Bacilli bacterium]|nr:response regulator transcription factor [Bacilli bacterium]